MKKFPFGVLWGGMLLAKGFSGNAAEIFEFFIGSASRGVMVMNEEAGGYRDFQKYSFSTHDYEHFEQLFGQITQTHCPLPAILKWFQSVKPDSDEGIRIKRWLTVTDSRHQNNYNTLGPQGGGGLGYSKVDAGVLSLPEVLLFQALAPFAGGAVAFFDPFLYNRKFWLRPVSQGVLPGSDIVIKTWVTHFFWRSEVTSFISGVGCGENDIEMKVVAEYKNNHLQWYRVQLSGLPGLVFKRVTVKNDRQNDQSITPKRGMQPVQEAYELFAGKNVRTGQPDSGYSSFNPGQPLSGSNVQPYQTTGLYIQIGQTLLRLTGYGFLANGIQ